MDELDDAFLTLVISSARIDQWLATLRAFKAGSAPLQRARTALRELVEALASEAYADEARRAGAVPLLTSLLKRTDDEELLNACSDALAACSGLMATSGKVRTFEYGGIPLVLKEGALGDGVGAKVWTVAKFMCREMANHPAMVRGLRVLEIGAGCGACGILAAKLGAAEVALTDYVDAVLRNLRDCVHMNAGGSSGGGGGSGSSAASGSVVGTNGGHAVPAGDGLEIVEEEAVQRRAELAAEAAGWDPEDASECGSDDFDALLGEAAGSGAAAGGTQGHGGEQGSAARAASDSWDAPPMHVRFYDWQDSVEALPPGERAALLASLAAVPACSAPPPGGTIDVASNEVGAPALGLEERYDVILGTDVLYEWPMTLMVPSVIKHRLRPGGRALLCCAVREQSMFDATARAMAALGLRAGFCRVQPAAEDVLDIRQDYEGGYALVAVEHAGQPAAGWHRGDLFDS